MFRLMLLKIASLSVPDNVMGCLRTTLALATPVTRHRSVNVAIRSLVSGLCSSAFPSRIVQTQDGYPALDLTIASVTASRNSCKRPWK